MNRLLFSSPAAQPTNNNGIVFHFTEEKKEIPFSTSKILLVFLLYLLFGTHRFVGFNGKERTDPII